MPPHSLEHRRPSLLAADDLHELHRRQHEPEALVEREGARVGVDRMDREALGGSTLADCARQLGLAVERPDLVPGTRKRERDPAAAAAEFEDRIASRGELGPELEIGCVGAVLDLVPDRD